jgi:hypothetical protein
MLLGLSRIFIGVSPHARWRGAACGHGDRSRATVGNNRASITRSWCPIPRPCSRAAAPIPLRRSGRSSTRSGPRSWSCIRNRAPMGSTSSASTPTRCAPSSMSRELRASHISADDVSKSFRKVPTLRSRAPDDRRGILSAYGRKETQGIARQRPLDRQAWIRRS